MERARRYRGTRAGKVVKKKTYYKQWNNLKDFLWELAFQCTDIDGEQYSSHERSIPALVSKNYSQRDSQNQQVNNKVLVFDNNYLSRDCNHHNDEERCTFQEHSTQAFDFKNGLLSQNQQVSNNDLPRYCDYDSCNSNNAHHESDNIKNLGKKVQIANNQDFAEFKIEQQYIKLITEELQLVKPSSSMHKLNNFPCFFGV